MLPDHSHKQSRSRGFVVGSVMFNIPLLIGQGIVSPGKVIGIGQSLGVILLITEYVPLAVFGLLLAGIIGGIGGEVFGNYTDDPDKERLNRNLRTYSLGVIVLSLFLGLILELVLCSGVLSLECVDIIPYV
jgi:hypothetical protein